MFHARQALNALCSIGSEALSGKVASDVRVVSLVLRALRGGHVADLLKHPGLQKTVAGQRCVDVFRRGIEEASKLLTRIAGVPESRRVLMCYFDDLLFLATSKNSASGVATQALSCLP